MYVFFSLFEHCTKLMVFRLKIKPKIVQEDSRPTLETELRCVKKNVT